jgi:Right handed beta helix region
MKPGLPRSVGMLVACAALGFGCGTRSPGEGGGLYEGDGSDSGSNTRPKPDAGPGTDASGHGSEVCAAIADYRTTATSPTAISLAWAGAPGTSVTVSRKTFCGTDAYVTLKTLPAGTTSYTDDTVQTDWNYWYAIAATDGAGDTASVALATQAATDPANGCSGGVPGRSSGITATCGSSSADAGGGRDGASPKDSGPADSGVTVTIVPAFYVATTGNDGNAGTKAAPFATLGKAQSAMQASSTIKTTYIRAGSYILPTLDCGSGTTCGLQLGSADDGETWSYYPPDGVDSADFTGGSTSSGTGLVIALSVSANQVTINGLSIHDFQYAGIGSGGGADHLLIENNVISNGYIASGSSNPGGVSCYGCANTTISHNVIHDMAMFGVSMSNVNGDISNLLVTGNVVYNTCTAIADCGALYVQDTKAIATNLQFTDNYIHDGNTFAALGSGYGAALYADDCTSNVTESGNVLTGRNGANTTMVHGGSNVHQIGNLTDLGGYQQRVAVFQTSGVAGCSSATMSGNEYENNVVIGEGGGGSFALLSGSPLNKPTIANNDYYNYGGAAISSGGAYSDSSPSSVDPKLSGWDYEMASTSAVLKAPVSFPPLVGGWGPPGYVLPESGTAPSSPH